MLLELPGIKSLTAALDGLLYWMDYCMPSSFLFSLIVSYYWKRNFPMNLLPVRWLTGWFIGGSVIISGIYILAIFSPN